jgi:hypothetical protein
LRVLLQQLLQVHLQKQLLFVQLLLEPRLFQRCCSHGR